MANISQETKSKTCDSKHAKRLIKFYQVVKAKGRTIYYLEKWIPEFLNGPFQSAERVRILGRMAELMFECIVSFCKIFKVTKKEVLSSRCLNNLGFHSSRIACEAFTWLVKNYAVTRKNLIPSLRRHRFRLNILSRVGYSKNYKLLKFIFREELCTREDVVRNYCNIPNTEVRQKMWKYSEPIGLFTKAVKLGKYE